MVIFLLVVSGPAATRGMAVMHRVHCGTLRLFRRCASYLSGLSEPGSCARRRFVGLFSSGTAVCGSVLPCGGPRRLAPRRCFGACCGGVGFTPGFSSLRLKFPGRGGSK